MNVINKRDNKGIIKLKCEIIKGNEEELFYKSVKEDSKWELRIKKEKIEKEKKSEYKIKIKMDKI